jgi:excinuclease UvrABC nuclease subunit
VRTIPFLDTTAYNFDQATVNYVLEVGGVYGLAQPNPARLGWYFILYVGKSGNLRERLQSHLNNPPVAGITHFFADRVDGEAARTLREASLIAEFSPAGNTLLK